MRFVPKCSTNPRVLQRRGDEPATARSPLRLRLLISGFAVPLLAAAGVLAVLGARAGTAHRSELILVAVLCAVLTVVAVLDIAVVRCRLRVIRAGARRHRALVPPHGGVPTQRGQPTRPEHR